MEKLTTKKKRKVVSPKKIKKKKGLMATFNLFKTKNGYMLERKIIDRFSDDTELDAVTHSSSSDSETELFEEFLYEILYNFGPSYDKYGNDNVYILKAPGRNNENFTKAIEDWAGFYFDK